MPRLLVLSMAMQQLFLGGVRSGKSQLAERAADASGRDVVYIATAELFDDGMRVRAHQHRQRRPAHWSLVETPRALAASLKAHDSAARCLLVDCLTLWLNNVLADGEDAAQRAIDELLDTLPSLLAEVIFVSGETGLGVMPANALARRYVDLLGELNQAIARRCERVTLAVAGLSMVLKSDLTT